MALILFESLFSISSISKANKGIPFALSSVLVESNGDVGETTTFLKEIGNIVISELVRKVSNK